jgi:ribosome-binding protein aMBF1 (putative translation factor)
MNCDFCLKRVAQFIVLVQNKEINICQSCNKRWQLSAKAVA